MTSKSDRLKAAFPPRYLDLEMQQDYVLVQLPKPPEKKGSIILAEQSKDALAYTNCVGKVMAMGPGVFKRKDVGDDEPGAVTYDVGDYVLVPLHGGRQRTLTDSNTGERYDVMTLEVIKVSAKLNSPVDWLD